MSDAWVQFLGIRFGYPSEIVSEQNVFEREVKRHRDIRANVFVLIALTLLAAFAFWGFGTLESNEMGVIHCLGLLLCGIYYFVLVALERKQYKRALEVFNIMQEDLDAKVDLQVERNYAVDSSPITQISAILDEIIARNTSKFVDEDSLLAEEEHIEKTPEETSEEAPEEPAEVHVEEPEDDLAEISEEEGEEAQTEEVEEPVSQPDDEEFLDDELEEEMDEESDDEEFLDDELEEDIEEEAEEEGYLDDALEEEEDISDEELEEEIDGEEFLEDELEEESEEEEEETEEESADVEEREENSREEAQELRRKKLAKLPALIDVMLSLDISRSMKIKFAVALIAMCNKFKDKPEEKAVLIECLKKMLIDLTQSYVSHIEEKG